MFFNINYGADSAMLKPVISAQSDSTDASNSNKKNFRVRKYPIFSSTVDIFIVSVILPIAQIVALYLVLSLFVAVCFQYILYTWKNVTRIFWLCSLNMRICTNKVAI